jgi:2-polyprenyl-3-methyl-5-hydroxy-6-metoxy-1,4-benzoquinol methylase
MKNSNSSDFNFKEIDPEGRQTLETIAEAHNFNRWTYDIIRPYCKGTILEIGSGIGNISKYFLEDNFQIHLSDIRNDYRNFLKTRFPETDHLGRIHHLDLVDPDFDSKFASFRNSFDTIFALNVIEHIQNDKLAIRNAISLLKPGGRLIILVPAFAVLYNNFDKELMHFKRYSANDLNQLLSVEGLKILDSFYFNAGGIPGWFFSGSLQKNKTIPPQQMKAFDKLVPFFRILDKMLLRKVGLSVIAIGEKN